MDERSRPAPAFDPADISMPGWQLIGQDPNEAFWRDAAGDVVNLELAAADPDMPALSDEGGLRDYCRRVAERQGAGLLEVATEEGAEGPCLTYVYKRLELPAFAFFGVVEIPMPRGKWVWMLVTGERGTTGVREAVVTARLFESGRLTLESYRTSWASDPYAPAYAGVDRRTLRYLSDGAEYDAEFPDHPLTKARRELRRLVGTRISPPATSGRDDTGQIVPS